MTRILLLNDTDDFDNWGGNACSELLKAIIRESIPDVRFISVLSHWTTDRFYQYPWWFGGTIGTRRKKFIGKFMKPLSFLPVVADDFERIADEWCNGKGGPFAQEFLTKLKQSDGVVFNAEGATYKNNSSAIRCLFALWLTEKRFRKPAFFTNGSVTLTSVLPILNAMVQRTFRSLSGVSVREPCSLENVRKWAPETTVEMFPDSVFFSANHNTRIENTASIALIEHLKDKDYFCFSLSMLISSITGYRSAGIETTALFDLIKSLQKLVPHAVLMAKDGMDQAIIRDLVRSTGGSFFGPEHHYSTLVPLFQNSRFMISGRYHHLIMASIAGCPAIPLKTTSHKVDGLCRLMGPLLGEPFDPTWLRPSINQIADRVRDAIAGGEDLRLALRQKALECGQLAAGIGEMIRKGLAR